MLVPGITERDFKENTRGDIRLKRFSFCKGPQWMVKKWNGRFFHWRVKILTLDTKKRIKVMYKMLYIFTLYSYRHLGIKVQLFFRYRAYTSFVVYFLTLFERKIFIQNDISLKINQEIEISSIEDIFQKFYELHRLYFSKVYVGKHIGNTSVLSFMVYNNNISETIQQIRYNFVQNDRNIVNLRCRIIAEL